MQKITREQRLIEKSRGYYLTDRNTPLIGDFVTAVERIVGPDVFFKPKPELAFLSSWSSYFPEEVQYPNEVADVDPAIMGLPSSFHLDIFRDYLAKAETLDELMDIPLFDDRNSTQVEEIPDDVVIDDDCGTLTDAAVEEVDVTDAVNQDAVDHYKRVCVKCRTNPAEFDRKVCIFCLKAYEWGHETTVNTIRHKPSRTLPRKNVDASTDKLCSSCRKVPPHPLGRLCTPCFDKRVASPCQTCKGPKEQPTHKFCTRCFKPRLKPDGK